jgi:UDP-galactopyranose mutase
MPNYLVVGAGLAGAVLANRLATIREAKVTVIDKRDHLAGNSHTERCSETGIMQHMYGAHIFHTSSKPVWDFVNRYADMRTFVNTPFAEHDEEYYPLPINLDTLERFFKRRFTPQSAFEFVSHLGCRKSSKPANFREQGLMLLGEDLYYAFFHGYTKKQWGANQTTYLLLSFHDYLSALTITVIITQAFIKAYLRKAILRWFEGSWNIQVYQ